jgi:hypothetical protein
MPEDRVAIYRALLTEYFCTTPNHCDGKFPVEKSSYVLGETAIPVRLPSEMPPASACMRDVPWENKRDSVQHRFPRELVKGTSFRFVTRKQADRLTARCEYHIIKFGEVSFALDHRYAMLRLTDGSEGRGVVLEQTENGWRVSDERMHQCDTGTTISDYACPQR